MRHVKEDHWGHAQRSSRIYKSAPAHLFPRTSSAAADASARTCTPPPRSRTRVTTTLASPPDACGALKSRVRPRSSPPGTPRRQVPARGRPRRRRFRRLRLGIDALRQRDEDVEGGAPDAVRHAHQCGLDDLRRRGAPPRPRRLLIREPPPRSWGSYVSVTKATMPSPGRRGARPPKPVSATCERAASAAWGARANAPRRRLGASRRVRLHARRRQRGTACAERRRRLRSGVGARAVVLKPTE